MGLIELTGFGDRLIGGGVAVCNNNQWRIAA